MRTSRAYILIAIALIMGIILGGSPLLEGMHPGTLVHQALSTSSDSARSAEHNMPQRAVSSSLRAYGSSTSTLTSLSSTAHAQRQGQGEESTTVLHERRSHAPRLLFMMASYTMEQLGALQKTLDCMRDICNAGWNVTVHVQTASDLVYDHERYQEFQRRLWCADAQDYVPLILEHYDKIGFGLNARHRIYMRKHVMDYDYFSFAEEDMLLTISHLTAFVAFQNHMKVVLPKTHLRYTIGFLRYEDSSLDTERVSWEYTPSLIDVADMGVAVGQFLVTTNLNQAIYLLSQEQVLDLQDRCGFLSDYGQNAFYRELRKAMDKDWKYLAVGVSEWSSSFQQILQCGMRRVIPVQQYEQFMIHHAVNKAQHRRPRKELLNARELHTVVLDKLKHPITMKEAFDTKVYNQYNLGLIDTSKFEGRSVWSWGVDEE